MEKFNKLNQSDIQNFDKQNPEFLTIVEELMKASSSDLVSVVDRVGKLICSMGIILEYYPKSYYLKPKTIKPKIFLRVGEWIQCFGYDCCQHDQKNINDVEFVREHGQFITGIKPKVLNDKQFPGQESPDPEDLI